MSRLRTYLELARISNLPTVWSNVLVGAALGGMSFEHDWSTLLAIGLAVSLLYIGGMILNDFYDTKVDTIERPSRPIPSGRVSKRVVGWLGAIHILAGVCIVYLVDQSAGHFAIGLAVAIWVYDILHKHQAGAVLLMGLCRGFVYFLAAAAVADTALSDPRVFVFAASLALTTTAFTLIARTEASDKPLPFAIRAALAAVPVIATLAVGFFNQSPAWIWPAIAATPCIAWLVRAAKHALATPPRTKQAILAWIAGIALIDAFFLTLLGRPELAIAAAVCFALTLAAHRRIMGT